MWAVVILWWLKFFDFLLIFLLENGKQLYICTPFGALSSAGSEHLPYKQGVTGSNPVGPTSKIKPSQM